MADSRSPVICIVGPTASGKTDAAQLVAAAVGGEVVSADSMQIYRGMDIGTGKLPADERIVPHHGFDLVDPGEPYSAALFQTFARSAFRDIADRDGRPVLCGGTGLYVRAAIDDYAFPAGEQTDNPVRAQWTAFAEQHGAQALWDELERRDPASAAVVHPNNVRRVVRAFELLAEGRSYAEQKRNLAAIGAAVPTVQFGLAVDPAVLAARINARVDAMVAAGLVEEVRDLMAAGFREGITAPQAIGYKEIVEALEGRCTLDEAVAAIKQATRRYAKRQRTWFRRDERIRWVDANAGDARRVADQILSQLSKEPTP
ncbi:tRNA (adenosine(37)-N6)-dimethylallyltransferase MiaA [Adlercreutzia sp. R21]|uniref:tRNA dimethylallyltransferase n=1 Tax=Adlercreutzia wanghongyangiae TaxID=3111451 RepID=A0ABU6IHL2_9ACTN|nr:tRNA (adenosine(37)-N6)-dimethylallyltransferase MiaA [Adlercreutzia sp. R21]MEC4175912.1 tRNA (adenosine(37)-N6)-dimethylallyltransferase MiaA [Adlercreutzia sp. R7]MEC4184104.1 tRNA (adenosine(37)-N6)-dimethylallyltransferase MiaA [Adlercreutzia sp. R21]